MSTVIVLKRCSTRVGYGRVDSGGVVPVVRPELLIAKPAVHDTKICVPGLASCESLKCSTNSELKLDRGNVEPRLLEGLFAGGRPALL